MVKELLLMRHGKAKRHAKLTKEDMGLTEEGRALVEGTANFIKWRFRVSRIYSSPIRRAKETAELVGEVLGAPLTMDERLAEYSYGDCEGFSYEELRSRFGVEEEEGVFFAKEALGLHRHTTYESYDSVKERVLAFLSEAESGTLAVSHGEVMRTVMCEHLGRREHLLERERVENCEVWLLKIDGKQVRELQKLGGGSD